MSKTYIYIVGQPDPHLSSVNAIRALGYKVGILSDTQRTLKSPENYDRVEKINFEQLDGEIKRLQDSNIEIAGLLCTYENYIVSKAKLSKAFGVPSLSVESARLSTDKSLMRQAFINEDPSISPNFTTINSIEEALTFAKQYGYPLIIKPTNLVKSLLVIKCENKEQLIDRFTYAHKTIGDLYKKYKIYDRTPQLIIEEFITGEQYSIAAFVDTEGTPHFCDGIVSLKNAQNIGVDDNYIFSRTLPANLSTELSEEMFRVASTGVRALKMQSSPAHIELMAGPSGVKIIEIGARIGGYRPRMYQYSYSLDLIKQEVGLAIGKQPELKGNFSKYSAVYELFPKTEGLFNGISGVVDQEKFTYFRVTKPIGTLIGPAKNGYKATVIIIVSESDPEIFHTLCKQAEQLKVEVQS